MLKDIPSRGLSAFGRQSHPGVNVSPRFLPLLFLALFYTQTTAMAAPL